MEQRLQQLLEDFRFLPSVAAELKTDLLAFIKQEIEQETDRIHREIAQTIVPPPAHVGVDISSWENDLSL